MSVRASKTGKLTGNTIVFEYEYARGKRTDTGIVSGDEIGFNREGGAQGAQEFFAERTS